MTKEITAKIKTLYDFVPDLYLFTISLNLESKYPAPTKRTTNLGRLIGSRFVLGDIANVTSAPMIPISRAHLILQIPNL